MKQKGVVTARRGLRLRESPHDGSTIDILQRGEELEILDEQTWLHVRVGGREGFVSADYIEPAETLIVPEAGLLGEVSADDEEIIELSHPQVIGKPAKVAASFAAKLLRLVENADHQDIKIYVTSSLRKPGQYVPGAVVNPASMSNHYVGHAIDMNLMFEEKLYNSRAMSQRNLNQLPDQVRQFLEAISADGTLRWGGDFDPEDPVHIDDGLNVKHPARYVLLLEKAWA